MHTYAKNNDTNFVVGYFILERSYGDGEQCVATSSWVQLSQHSNEHEAMCRVNFLNGGGG